MSRITISDLNDKQRAMIPAGVRGHLGKAAQTTAEAVAKADDKAERELQSDIANYLALHEIEFIRPPMNKRSALPSGWPDFTLAYQGVPLALEAKTPSGILSADQCSRHEALRRNGWRVFVVYGVPNVQTIFREIDAEKNPPAAALAQLRTEARG